jgi:hypothetical protein
MMGDNDAFKGFRADRVTVGDPRLRHSTVLRLPLSDMWFEPGIGGSRLMVAALLGPEGETAFQVNLMGGSITFRSVADIKGLRVFAASEWHAADDPEDPSQGPSWILAGPFQGGAV